MSESATPTETATNGANVPVTAMSNFVPQGPGWTALVIGTERPNWSNLNVNNNTPFWWLVVVDLTNLNVVANVIADGVNVPSAVQPYVNNPQYFVFCISNCQTGAQIPYGAFYSFLQQVGGGPELARLEQVYNQLSSGIIANYSYVLAASMDTTDYPGFETLSFAEPTVLAMQFQPITVGGNTTYAPINPFAS
jgi:hypothetical protein